MKKLYLLIFLGSIVNQIYAQEITFKVINKCHSPSGDLVAKSGYSGMGSWQYHQQPSTIKPGQTNVITCYIPDDHEGLSTCYASYIRYLPGSTSRPTEDKCECGIEAVLDHKINKDEKLRYNLYGEDCTLVAGMSTDDQITVEVHENYTGMSGR